VQDQDSCKIAAGGAVHGCWCGVCAEEDGLGALPTDCQDSQCCFDQVDSMVVYLMVTTWNSLTIACEGISEPVIAPLAVNTLCHHGG
jgi:hypothetical protein